MIRRREFVALFGGAAAWPLAARELDLSRLRITEAGREALTDRNRGAPV
jgi:hypothetical protein